MAAPAAAMAVAVAVLCAAFAPRALAGWGRPFRLAQPAMLDLLPAEITFSPNGAAAIGFGVQDADDPAVSDGLLALRSGRGRGGALRSVPRAQEILDLAFDGSGLQLLTGTSPKGQTCCSSAQVVSVTGSGRFGRPHTLLSGLTGATIGQLEAAVGHGLVAAIATDQGVWVAQSSGSGGFGGAHRLTSRSAQPQTMAASSLSGGGTAVAWTANAGGYAGSGPRTIFVASSMGSGPPQGARAALTVRRAHQVDELGLASGTPGTGAPTVAWIESWIDRAGAFQSQVKVADLNAVPRPRSLSPLGEFASGLAFAANARGDQVVGWQACSSSGSCSVKAAVRRAGKRFARVNQLGPIDATQTPAVAIAPRGEALLGWISSGHVLVADSRAGATRFSLGRAISDTSSAADLTLAFAPSGRAMAAWAQGTLNQSLVGAVYRHS